MRIRETIGRGILHAIRSQFATPYDAVHELVDNALDHRLDQQVVINIELGIDSFSVENIGGRGMGPSELAEFVSWGASNRHEDSDRGMYGQGGKGALCYLGRGFRLWCRHAKTTEVYCLEDEDILGRTECADYGDAIPLPAAMVPSVVREIPHDLGYVFLESVGFDTSLSLTQSGLSRDIAAAYAPMLRAGDVLIRVNGQAVNARSVALSKDIDRVSILAKIGDVTAIGWAGKIERGANKANPPRPGFSIYWRGRRIMEGVWFGANSYGKGSLASFYGELLVDGVRPNLNKTGLAETGEVVWDRLGDEILQQSAPILDALKGSLSGTIINGRDQRLARQVQEELQGILDHVFDEFETITTTEKRPIRIPSKRKDADEDATKRGPRERTTKKMTDPDRDASVVRVVKAPRVPRIIVDSWDQPTRAETRNTDKGTVIAINKAHPAFSAATAKFAIAEGVVMECLRSGTLSGIDEFISQADEILAAWAQASGQDED